VTTELNPMPENRLIMALPNGRILGEVMPLLRHIGIEPEPALMIRLPGSSVSPPASRVSI